MARAIHKLTAEDVEMISNPGRHSDGGGLYLYVSGERRRSWVFLFTWRGKLREAGLGAAIDGGVSLPEARAKAEEGRALVKGGVDPIEEWSKPPSKDGDQTIVDWLRGVERLPHPDYPSPGRAELVRRFRSREPLGERLGAVLAMAFDPIGKPGALWLKLEPREGRVRGRPPKPARRNYERQKDNARVEAGIVAEAAGGRKPKRYLVVEDAARAAGRGRSTVYDSLKIQKQARQARELDE